VPIFNPGQFSANYLDSTTEFDLGISYMIERGHKRQARIQAAKDQTLVTRSQVSGPVSRILVSPGEVVHTDQPMLYVSSPDYAQLRSTYLKARDALELAEKSYNRASDLYAHHAIAEADLQ
jgi:multidrug efflux pump subunit AcrA (membrane-fusion protein)